MSAPGLLRLLTDVSWAGTPVAGERSKALLAALTAAEGRVVADRRLIGEVWGLDEAPANPTKALQVLVSRTRNQTAADVVQRTDAGYRLGPVAVDALERRQHLAAAVAASRAGDLGTARAEAATVLDSIVLEPGDGEDPLRRLRRKASADSEQANVVLGLSLSGLGAHAEALPVLESVVVVRPDDDTVLAALLQSEAATRGAPAALQRYQGYRRSLRDRLGTDPGPELRRVHAEVLAADRPVREGLLHEGTRLIGREEDVAALTGLLRHARVVSIMGAGGLGKTRLAHVVGRAAPAPVVHFIELVGVTAPEDLIGEVGSELGVRDSVSGRRTLTAEQRADVRARIAQHLDRAPSLLILDNCEHIVEAVADLVAYLVATTRDLRVLTTTRAALSIGAERIYHLGELDAADGVELFGQRARSARPDVRIDAGVAADIVTRLDGLPLAIELAAAKVRVMSVEDIGRRLENRFALLRGGDRSAPDRHQTLLAVIDWSWNLLAETERYALRRLSVFHDGFTLEAAETLLEADALETILALVDQSLLVVRESRVGVRYRMLETVREFGRMQLVDAGEDEGARSAQRVWATAYASRYGGLIFGASQFSAVDAFEAEENNLADVLRQALGEPDPAAVVQLLAGLAAFWSVRGDHARVIVLTEAIVQAIDGWYPPSELEDVTRVALVLTLNNAMIADDRQLAPIRSLLQRLGYAEGSDHRIAAMTKVMLCYDPKDVAKFQLRLEELSDDPDRYAALIALQWYSHVMENAGDPHRAVESASRALELARPEDGPWTAAILQTQLAELTMQLGERAAAARHARAAIPVLERLGAIDDEIQLRSLLATWAIAEGRLDEAADEFDRIASHEDTGGIFGGAVIVPIGRAELALARGDRAAGLALYRIAVDRMRALAFPGVAATGMEPWVLFGEAIALTAYAIHGGPAQQADALELYASCRSRVPRALDVGYPFLDYPVSGALLFALAAWGAYRGAFAAEDVARLLVLAGRFAYSRSILTMSWDNVAHRVEELAPGRIAAIEMQYADRRGQEVLNETRAFVEDLLRD